MPPKAVDLSGQVFGELTVLRRNGTHVTPSGGKKAMWLCECSCGVRKVIAGESLRRGHSKSCGCSNVLSLEGKKYHRLTVLEKVVREEKSNTGTKFKCLCDCGAILEISGSHLKSGHTKSCGCYKSEKISEIKTKHGNAKKGKLTKEYHTYHGMIARCTYEAHRGSKHYLKRGIDICARWKESFENFLEDMGPAPSKMHSIDRIDNTKGYSPENCRWATSTEQARNKSNNRMVAWEGKQVTLAELAEILGKPYKQVQYRLNRGYSLTDWD
jgi:hypothetical protein